MNRHRRVYHQRVEVDGERYDWREILHRIVIELSVECRRDRVVVGAARRQRIAVRRRPRHEAHADATPGAGHVFHDHALAKCGAETLRRHARHGVADAAGRIGHHHLDRMVRKLLGPRQRHSRRNGARYRPKLAHFSPPLLFPSEPSLTIGSTLSIALTRIARVVYECISLTAARIGTPRRRGA